MKTLVHNFFIPVSALKNCDLNLEPRCKALIPGMKRHNDFCQRRHPTCLSPTAQHPICGSQVASDGRLPDKNRRLNPAKPRPGNPTSVSRRGSSRRSVWWRYLHWHRLGVEQSARGRLGASADRNRCVSTSLTALQQLPACRIDTALRSRNIVLPFLIA